MRILWDCGESNVRQVVERLERPVAYMTAMTTLDRRFKRARPPRVEARPAVSLAVTGTPALVLTVLLQSAALHSFHLLIKRLIQ